LVANSITFSVETCSASGSIVLVGVLVVVAATAPVSVPAVELSEGVVVAVAVVELAESLESDVAAVVADVVVDVVVDDVVVDDDGFVPVVEEDVAEVDGVVTVE
jgi:hypothetical protein